MCLDDKLFQQPTQKHVSHCLDPFPEKKVSLLEGEFFRCNKLKEKLYIEVLTYIYCK